MLSIDNEIKAEILKIEKKALAEMERIKYEKEMKINLINSVKNNNWDELTNCKVAIKFFASDDINPLIIAIRLQHQSCVEKLIDICLEHKVSFLKKAIVFVIQNNLIDYINLLYVNNSDKLSYTSRYSVEQEHPLLEIAQLDNAQVWMQRICQVNIGDNVAIIAIGYAIRKSKIHNVDYLLSSYEHNISDSDHLSFLELAINESPTVINILLDKTKGKYLYENPNELASDMWGANLFDTAFTGHEKSTLVITDWIITNLSFKGQKEKAQNLAGSALFFAVVYNRYETAKVLLEKGADPNWIRCFKTNTLYGNSPGYSLTKTDNCSKYVIKNRDSRMFALLLAYGLWITPEKLREKFSEVCMALLKKRNPQMLAELLKADTDKYFNEKYKRERCPRAKFEIIPCLKEPKLQRLLPFNTADMPDNLSRLWTPKDCFTLANFRAIISNNYYNQVFVFYQGTKDPKSDVNVVLKDIVFIIIKMIENMNINNKNEEYVLENKWTFVSATLFLDVCSSMMYPFAKDSSKTLCSNLSEITKFNQTSELTDESLQIRSNNIKSSVNIYVTNFAQEVQTLSPKKIDSNTCDLLLQHGLIEEDALNKKNIYMGSTISLRGKPYLNYFFKPNNNQNGKNQKTEAESAIVATPAITNTPPPNNNGNNEEQGLINTIKRWF